MKRDQKIIFLLIVLSLLPVKIMFAQSANIILTNGKIFTSDTAQLYVQELAIKGNKILAVGSNTTVEKLASAKTKRIDLEGKTVVSGINDAHDHLGWHAPVGVGYTYSRRAVAGPCKAAVFDSVSKLVKIAKPDQWILRRYSLLHLPNL